MSKFYRLRGYIECGETDKALAYLDHIEPILDKVLLNEADAGNVRVVLLSGVSVSQETHNRILKFFERREEEGEGSDEVLAIELPPGAKVKVRVECTTCRGRRVVDCEDCAYWGMEGRCGYTSWPECQYAADGKPCPECNGTGVEPVT
jgi:hypothetical protein